MNTRQVATIDVEVVSKKASDFWGFLRVVRKVGACYSSSIKKMCPEIGRTIWR